MPKPAPKPAAPLFLNVDLDLELNSGNKLEALFRAMGRKVIVLHSGPHPRRKGYFAVLELSRECRGPDATILALCSVVDDLPPSARRIWKAARKTFNIGYDLRPSERSSSFTLRHETLKRVVAVGATLTVTYYRGE